MNEGLLTGEAPPGGTVATLVLQSHADWVPNYYPMQEVRPQADGSVEVDIPVADPRWLMRLLLRLAPYAAVVAPEEFTETFTATAQETLGPLSVRVRVLLNRQRRCRSDDESWLTVLPMIWTPQGAEWFVILAIVVLVFGAAKLPELARGTGQALRIFKAETKGLRDDDEDGKPTPKPTPAGELNAADEVAEGEIVDEQHKNNS